jgi:hypothetical protein
MRPHSGAGNYCHLDANRSGIPSYFHRNPPTGRDSAAGRNSPAAGNSNFDGFVAVANRNSAAGIYFNIYSDADRRRVGFAVANKNSDAEIYSNICSDPAAPAVADRRRAADNGAADQDSSADFDRRVADVFAEFADTVSNARAKRS